MNTQSPGKKDKYRNVLLENGYSPEQIDRRVNEVFHEMFFGPDRIYQEDGRDMGYMVDTGNDDARTEGMSYGMMMAVQMDNKDIFDRLWRWSLTYMHHDSGKYKDYFAWSCALDGTRNAQGPAPDGEEYFAMALFFASHRWGDGEPPFDYSNQARKILRACVHKGSDRDTSGQGGDPMWDPETYLIKFVPEAPFTDPSYHIPHFYELFSLWADEEDRAFWAKAAEASRAYLHKAVNPDTGLAPNLSNFNGSPLPIDESKGIWGVLGSCYFSDAYRVAINLALDWDWFGKDPWQPEILNTLLSFVFTDKRASEYVLFPDGRIFDKEPIMHPVGMKASWACASLAVDGEYSAQAVRRFWDMPLRRDKRRYYDNCLYFFTLLALSGRYRIW
ncbi:MAG: xylanase [Clostridiales bacterium]|nr:xylanase [Clostridiales bacterium]